MLLIIGCIFLLRKCGTRAVPLPNPSLALPATFPAFSTPNFTRDDPSTLASGQRTLLDIIWSCLATIFACTWVSVHPNIPFRNEGDWTLRGRRIYLMFFSIFAPEFTVGWAFMQWRGAKMIKEAVNEAIKKAFPDPETHTPRLWNTAHGHFLQMGGYRLAVTARENFYFGGQISRGLRKRELLDCMGWGESNKAIIQEDLDSRLAFFRMTVQKENLVWVEKRTRNLIHHDGNYRHEVSAGSWVTQISDEDMSRTDSSVHIWEGVLRLDALVELFEEGLIRLPSISEDEINYKSKGDTFSKGFAFLQLTWFVVQIIARASQGLAISELELTTAALAGLNSIMYCFWWSKPRDVRFPVVLRTKAVDALIARRPEDNMDSNYSVDRLDLSVVFKRIGKSIGFFFKSFPFKLLRSLNDAATSFTTPPDRARTEETDSEYTCLAEGRPVVRAQVRDTNRGAESGGECPMASRDRIRHRETVDSNLLVPVRRSAEFSRNFLVFPLFFLLYIVDLAVFIPVSQLVNSIDPALSVRLGSRWNTESKRKTFRMIFYSEGMWSPAVLIASSVAGALFGMIHSLAWHFEFPSHAEKFMWRSASLGLAGSGVAASTSMMANILRFFLKSRSTSKPIRLCLQYIEDTLDFMASSVYFIARITLLVLSVTTLRSLPPSAFHTVDWVELVPHI